MRRLISIKTETAVKAAQWLLYLHGAIWVVFAVVTVFRAIAQWDRGTAFSWVSVLLMFANSALFVWIGYKIPARKAGVYLLALAVLLVNIFSTVTDQMGVFDGVVMITGLVTLVLLMVERKAFLTGSDAEEERDDHENR